MSQFLVKVSAVFGLTRFSLVYFSVNFSMISTWLILALRSLKSGLCIPRTFKTFLLVSSLNFLSLNLGLFLFEGTSVESLGYIKCYSSSSTRRIKSPSNAIRYNCKRIILEIRNKSTFLQVINNSIIHKFFKGFTNHRKKMIVFQLQTVPPTFLNTGTTNETFKQSGKQDSFRHLLKSSASM